MHVSSTLSSEDEREAHLLLNTESTGFTNTAIWHFKTFKGTRGQPIAPSDQMLSFIRKKNATPENISQSKKQIKTIKSNLKKCSIADKKEHFASAFW